MLECQVALKDFVAALDVLSNSPMFKVLSANYIAHM